MKLQSRLTSVLLLGQLAACKPAAPCADCDGAADDSTTSDGTDSSTDSTSMPPFWIPDMVGKPVCDPFMQDCLPGQKCVPYSSTGDGWDANTCVPITGDGAIGDTCTWSGILEATDDCGADSICWDVMDVEGVLTGVCTPFCGGTANDPICDPGSSCMVTNDGSVTLCIATCDPLIQDCGAGLGCFVTGSDFNCVFTTSDIPMGEPCGYINDCAPGHFCANAASLPSCEGSACCASFCNLEAPLCLLAQTECVSFFDEGMAPPGYEDIGVCILPP